MIVQYSVGKGLNPRGAQWHHDHTEKYDLHLVDKETHIRVHLEQGREGGY